MKRHAINIATIIFLVVFVGVMIYGGYRVVDKVVFAKRLTSGF